ncbi:AMP-binding protein [Rhodoferax lacus]|uniref:AMP-binding protein n=2 Tax=Rhodoferax lacus TaxID=2184758 RepID=A0A3E1RBT5_9BURK|nr:AMP-binding protein [Rhodoferax lacus]
MTDSLAPSPTAAHDLLALAAKARVQLTSPGAPFELETVQHGGQAVRAYRNAFANLPGLIQAGRVHGAKEFMVYQQDRWTFDRFFAAVDALAGRLQALHGLQAGERVAIAMRNRPEWAVAFAAVALVGAVPVPLNSFGLRDELLSNLHSVQPRWLICDQERHGRVAADLPALACQAIVVDAADTAGAALDWSALIAPGAPALQAPALDATDPALILFTSGATSQAKGVLSNQRAVCQALFNIDYIGAISAITSPAALARIMARGLQPTTLSAVPLFHVSGLHAQLLIALRHGRRLILMHRWDPVAALALIQAEQVTQFNGAPTMVQQLLRHSEFDDPAITGTLGGLGFGGGGLSQRLIDDVLTRRADSLSGIGFGLTETNGVGAAASGTLFQLRPTSAGPTSPIVEVRIVDAQGSDVAAGEAGEIWLRGVTVMDAYWGQPEASAQALQEAWFRSGDVGLVDADGFLRVVDRIKDVINRSGEKIAAAEVESCLLQHPHIIEAAVFSQADEVTGEAVVAAVVLAPGVALDGAAVQAFVAGRLAAYKVPVRVYVRQDALPRNPTGKLLKSILKREFLQPD